MRARVRRLAGLLASMLGGALVISACTTPPVLPAVELSAVGDPIPQVSVSKAVGPEGLQMDAGVVVEVPAGAVPTGHQFTVGIGRPLGAMPEGSREYFGVPVHVDHDADLHAPVLVKWDVSHLTEEQRSSLVLVRWDADLQVWAVAGEVAVLEGTTLMAEVTRFSFVNWVSGGAASVSQEVGEWSGKRADPPSCTNGSLPGWVTNVIRPDEDQPAMPIRTCVEPDKNDVLTVRVANNRPYTQVLELTEGDRYAWTWAGDADYTAAGIIRDTANRLMSGDQSLVMAPTRSTAVGLARPAENGQVRFTLTAGPSIGTVGTDVLVYVLENGLGLDDVGGFDSESLNTFVQSVYDCGGEQLLKSREVVGADTFQKVLETVKSCVDSDGVRSAIEDVLRSQIAKGGSAAANAVRTNRFLHQAMGKIGVYLTVSDFSSYIAELSSAGVIGDVSVNVFGTGTPQSLGSWKPTCTDPDADSGKLYRNLALQDAFKDTSKDYWQFPTWQSSSVVAVKPLAACPAAHIEAVATNVEKTWGDKKAAAVVAQSIRALGGGLLPAKGATDRQILNSKLPPHVCWSGEWGWDGDIPIQLRDGQGEAKNADGSFGDVTVLESSVLGRADLDGDGAEEIVLSLLCTGSPREHCCAGRSSLATAIAVFAVQRGKLTAVAPVLMGGASRPGDQYGPAQRRIWSVKLRDKKIVTTESIIYPEGYTPAQVGGDPFEQITVEYRLNRGSWTSSRA